MKKWTIGSAAACFVLLLAGNFLVWEEIGKRQIFSLVFFDVGQGDAILLQTPQGHQVLIDGGPEDFLLPRLSKWLPWWDRSIDAMILTHPEYDHISGFVSVLGNFKVENIFWTGVEKDTNTFRMWRDAMEKEAAEGAKVFLAGAGDVMAWGSEQNSIEIVYPEEKDKKRSALNDTSLVAKLVAGKQIALFPGDISSKAEKDLLLRGIPLEADILKVAHHGSKSSSAPAFIAAANPAIAVIQSGKDNSYGHPHEELLRILEERGIRVLRTDQNGDILIGISR